MKLLVPVDDSRFSDLALESVKLRLWDAATEIYVCSIVAENEGLKYFSDKQLQAAEAEQCQQMHYVSSMLQSKVAKLKWALPSNRVKEEIRIGPIGESIVDLASEIDADLIVLGSHGRHGIARQALGSVVEHVVSDAPCSVEIIRMSRSGGEAGGEATDIPPVLSQKRFLLCYDGSPNAKAALDWVARSRWMHDQEFVVLTVLAPIETERLNVKQKNGVEEEILSQAECMLESSITPLRRNPDLKLVQPEVCVGYAAEVILKFAEQWRADVIIMGVHSDKANQNPMIGSVARQVAADANCSVRLVKETFKEITTEHAGLPAIIRQKNQPISQWAINRLRKGRANVVRETVSRECSPRRGSGLPGEERDAAR